MYMCVDVNISVYLRKCNLGIYDLLLILIFQRYAFQYGPVYELSYVTVIDNIIVKEALLNDL